MKISVVNQVQIAALVVTMTLGSSPESVAKPVTSKPGSVEKVSVEYVESTKDVRSVMRKQGYKFLKEYKEELRDQRNAFKEELRGIGER